ncbi:unnamed protein product, partial [Cylicocyclus nassatus]
MHSTKIEALKRSLVSKVELFQKDANLTTNRTEIEKDIDELVKFETEMAQILVADEHRSNYSRLYNLRHLNNLQELMPLVDWSRFFLAIAPRDSHQYLRSNPEVLIAEIDYLRGITKVLN